MKQRAVAVATVVALGIASGCCKGKSSEDKDPPIILPGPDKSTTQLTAEPQKQGTPQQAQPAGVPTVNKGPAGPYSPLPRSIPDSCTEPAVLLATVPPSAPSPYTYPWTVQTMLVHDDFVQVRTPAELAQTPKSVMYLEGHVGAHRAIIARCHDATTCNHLAAMYKGVIRTSTPQVGCGIRSIGLTDTPAPKPLTLTLPARNDVIGRCARLNACIMATDHGYASDVGMQCQSAPMKFNLACTEKEKCAQVLSCAGY